MQKTDGLILIIYTSNDVFLRKELPFRGHNDCLKPNSITLAGSEPVWSRFGAGSELVRSWFRAEIWPIIQLASSELARASRFAAKFHYDVWFKAGSELVWSWFEAGLNQIA